MNKDVKRPKKNTKINIKNKGTGAGGCNTNKNGLPYEELTDVCGKIPIIEKKIFGKGANDYYEYFELNGKNFKKVTKSGLKKYLHKDFNKKCERSLQPDECFLDEDNKVIYILEKKFQQCAGSVDEKIQTAIFKKEFYKEQYPEYTIEYAYVLSDWFKSDKYQPEMRFLKKYNFKIFWGSDRNYIKQLCKWLV